jgi:hypothetical protein
LFFIYAEFRTFALKLVEVKHKKITLLPILFLTLAFLFSCRSGDNGLLSTDIVNNPNSAKGKADLSSLPLIKFDEEVHDFGKIIEGETVSYSFKFTNTGKSDLLIADVSTSCGCTVPSFPKTPVHPGKKGVVKIAFSSAGKRGFQAKNIVVVANTQPNTTIIRIKAQVVSPGSEK